MYLGTSPGLRRRLLRTLWLWENEYHRYHASHSALGSCSLEEVPPSHLLCHHPQHHYSPLNHSLFSSLHSFCRLPRATVTREGHVPGAVHSERSQIMTATPPQTSAKGSEAESNTPSSVGAQPQLSGPLGKQPGPSQTQNLTYEPVDRTQDLGKKIHAEPQKTSEDIRTEALAKEIVHQDKSLADILDPDSRMKTTMDLMEGLFPRDANVLKDSVAKRKALDMTARHGGCEAKM